MSNEVQNLNEFNIPMVEDCAPTINANNGICSTKEMLQNLGKWLEIESSKPEQIIKIAKEKTGCESEACVLKKAGISDMEIDKRFNPSGPVNNVNWLSNTNIDEVLDIWGLKFPGFHHIGFQMKDFADKNNALSTFDWGSAAKKYKSIGCVLNTDVSGGPGEHWTAFYVDIPGKTCEYWDSAGQTPRKEFTDLMITAAHGLGPGFKDISITYIEHQKENTECGVYSLFYIISRLHGIPFKRFMGKRIPDHLIVQFRKYIFRHDN